MSNCCDKCGDFGFLDSGCKRTDCPCHSTAPTSFVGFQYRADPNKKPDLDFTAPTGDGWEQTYRTSAMYAKDVKENELVVLLNTAIFLTGLLLSRTRQETEAENDITVSWDIADGGDNWVVQFWRGKTLLTQLDKNSDTGGNFHIRELKHRAGEMK